MEKINMQEKLDQIKEFWSPKIIAEINDLYVKIGKLKGEFLWHSHAEEDEMFYVLGGELTIRFRDGDVLLRTGEGIVIPRGVEHMPVAAEEAHVMMIEPKGTLNTGNVVNERTVKDPERIQHFRRPLHR